MADLGTGELGSRPGRHLLGWQERLLGGGTSAIIYQIGELAPPLLALPAAEKVPCTEAV